MLPGQVQVDGRVPDVGVAEQRLDAGEIGAGFQQVCGIAVPQGMRMNAFGDAGALGGYLSAAPKNGAIMAGRKGPAMWLRYGHCRRNGARCEVAPVVLGGMSFRGLRLLGSVGLAFDLQDDRSLDQPVEEGHRQRAIGEIVAPFVEVHVGDHRRGALLIA